MAQRKRPSNSKTLTLPKPRLPIAVRQTKVFELVVAGQNHEQICKRLRISEDTIERDMKAVASEVMAIVRERYGEILAIALATYQQTIDICLAEYKHDLEREQAWEAGNLDYVQTQRVEKRLGVAPASPSQPGQDEDEDEDEDDEDTGIFGEFINSLEGAGQAATPPAGDGSQESLPLEIKITRKRVRPGWRSSRERWVALMITATQRMTELCGLQTIKIEHGGTVSHEHTITLEQWKAEAATRLQTAEATLALQDEDDDA